MTPDVVVVDYSSRMSQLLQELPAHLERLTDPYLRDSDLIPRSGDGDDPENP